MLRAIVTEDTLFSPLVDTAAVPQFSPLVADPTGTAMRQQ